MMKILLLLILSVVLLSANIGKITRVKGDVSVHRDSQSFKGKSGFILKLHDKITTKNKSKALILFNDKTSITVGKSSTLSVDDFVLDVKTPTNSKASFRFGKGIFRAISGKIGKLNPSKFKLKTKSASMGIRGSEAYIEVDDEGSMSVDVIDGEFIANGQSMPKGTSGRVVGKSTKVAPTTPEQKKKVEEFKDDDESLAVEEVKSDKKDNTDEESEEEEKKTDEKDSEEEKQTTEEDSGEEEQVSDEEKSTEEQATDEQEPKEEEQVAQSETEEQENQPSEEPTKQAQEEQVEDNADMPAEFEETPDSEYVEPEETAPIPQPEVIKDIETVVQDTIEEEPADTTVVEEELAETPAEDTPDEEVPVDASYVEIVSDLPVSDVDALLVDFSSVTKEIVGSDTYMEFGYVVDELNAKTATYVTGSLTPNILIEQYIQNSNTASYSGGVAALVTDSAGNTVGSTGSINLDMDFGTQNLTGNINITEGNWQAEINSGDISSYGFSSSDITSGSASSVTDISGSVDGKFYGTEAQRVGGSFNLDSSTNGSVSGTFGGNQ